VTNLTSCLCSPRGDFSNISWKTKKAFFGRGGRGSRGGDGVASGLFVEDGAVPTDESGVMDRKGGGFRCDRGFVGSIAEEVIVELDDVVTHADDELCGFVTCADAESFFGTKEADVCDGGRP